jgi:flavin-dependent dehydrogenase
MLSAPSHFDLAIVGGGPAGASAAITAARSGARVALFESRQFPRHKVCGEFVSAESLDLLSELLADEIAIHSLFGNAPQLSRTRLWLGSRMLQAPVSPAALSITRFHLDDALWKAAQAVGVDCRANCEVSGAGGEGPFQLQTADGMISARALIVAAGRWSQFVADRALPPGPKWIGLKAHFCEDHPSLTTDLYFFEHGYCGIQPVAQAGAQPTVAHPSPSSGQALGHRAGDVVNACAMVRSDCASSLPEVFRLHPALRERTASWQALMPTVSTAPLVYRAPQAVRGNIVFVGDAAGFIDPFVGDGISIALRSGKLAAGFVGKFLSGESTLAESVTAYNDEYSRRFAPLLSVASRVRWVLSLPEPARAVAFELLRIPGVMPLLIRKTRRVA